MTQYNKRLNCIFVNIPRTASSSMSRLVMTGGHRPLLQRKQIMYEKGLKESYDDAYKFAFVRNPYDRFLSAMYHVRFFDVDNFLKAVNPMKILTNAHIMLFRPQVEFILDEKDEIMVDFLGRYENLEKDWEKVKNKLKIEEELAHLNKSDNIERLKKENLSKMSIKILNDFYEKDFKILNYDVL